MTNIFIEAKNNHKTLVMGIFNATPDSFSDGGELSDKTKLKARIESMIESGVDVLDVGGESTRPNFTPVDVSDETARVVPVIKQLRAISSSIMISIDTTKAAVAGAALACGANIINDISALSDPNMATVAKKYQCPIILMRNRALGQDVVASCRREIEKIVDYALAQGLQKTQIIIDPGLGFGDLKTNNYSNLPGSDVEANLALVRSIADYSFDYPVLIGASRKRFIGTMMNQPDPRKRLAGSLKVAILAANSGAAAVRVHDVQETIQVLKPKQGT